MKKIAPLVVAFLLTTSLLAQELQFSLGPAMTQQPETRSIFFNTTLKKGYAMAFSDPEFNEIDEYTRLNPSKKTIKAEIFTGKHKAMIDGYYAVGDKNYIIYSSLDRERNEHNVYMQQMSNDGLLFGTPLLVAKYGNAKVRQTVIVLGAPNLQSVSNLHVAKPSSNDFIVFVKEREAKLEIKAFSPEHGEMWWKSFNLKSDMLYRLTSIKVATNGNVYLSGHYYDGDEDLNPFVLAYNPTSKKVQLHDIQSGGKISDLGYRLVLTGNETPVLAGIYAQRKDVGYKVFKLNGDNFEIKLLASRPFSPKYTSIVFEGAYKPQYFGIKDIVELKNKSLVIDVEGGAVQSSGHVSQSYTSPVYLAAIGADGDEKWNSVIQKYQVQPLGSDLVGHALFRKNDKVYVMYNDDIDNLQASPTEKSGDGLLKKNMYVSVVEIDENGNAKKFRPITTVKNQNSYFRPSEIREISPNLFHMMFMKAGKYYFATVSAE
jgi:hypothetical protein